MFVRALPCDPVNSFVKNKSLHLIKLHYNELNPVYYVSSFKRSHSVIGLKAGSSFSGCRYIHKRSCIYSGCLAVKCIHSHKHTHTDRSRLLLAF